MVHCMKSFGKDFSDGLPLIMIASRSQLQFMAFAGIETKSMKEQTIELKNSSVTCHFETEAVLFLGTDDGKLYLIGE